VLLPLLTDAAIACYYCSTASAHVHYCCCCAIAVHSQAATLEATAADADALQVARVLPMVWLGVAPLLLAVLRARSPGCTPSAVAQYLGKTVCYRCIHLLCECKHCQWFLSTAAAAAAAAIAGLCAVVTTVALCCMTIAHDHWCLVAMLLCTTLQVSLRLLLEARGMVVTTVLASALEEQPLWLPAV
jgi:hypothetical protein